MAARQYRHGEHPQGSIVTPAARIGVGLFLTGTGGVPIRGEPQAQIPTCPEVPIPNTLFTFQLESEMLAELRRLAEIEDRSVAGVIRRAIRMMLDFDEQTEAAKAA